MGGQDGLNEPYRISPEFYVLYNENGMMRAELAALYEEYEHINRVLIPFAQTNFYIKVGALRVELLQQQISVMKTRRRIAILRNHLQMGETVHPDHIRILIEKEFHQWDARLRHEMAEIEDAKGRFSSIQPTEDMPEIRSIYRTLSRKMNPDVNADISEEAKTFWANIHTAYIWGDLFQLKALQMMAEDYPESYDMPTDIGAMRRANTLLKERIERMKKKIANTKLHPAFEWRRMLDDPEKLAGEQSKLREEINKMKIQRVALEDMLRSLELKGIKQ